MISSMMMPCKQLKRKEKTRRQLFSNYGTTKPQTPLQLNVRLYYSSNDSWIKGKPITGRTHQIRVHLKSTGHSIVNDVNYGGRFVGNLYPLHEMLAKSDENHEPEVVKKQKTNEEETKIDEKLITLGKENQGDEVKECEEALKDLNEKALDPGKLNLPADDYMMEIWLHSLRYTFGDRTFETDQPYWANKGLKFQISSGRLL
eukprot:TRINITY_DN4446_c0_g1_i9.p2 TRINITY_DN4446_c0_g1~~TRINITY_DN4446_c0_g1_i9.p2  ORF type:complete len:202 (-),score=23.25 TRINITY_DN4446_c0_g1_i9:114-719(-)